MTNLLFNNDCLDRLKLFKDNSIDLTVTSPPYDDLRTYGSNKHKGNDYKSIAEELYRVTKQGGSLFGRYHLRRRTLRDIQQFFL